MKLHAVKPTILLKRDSNTDVNIMNIATFLTTPVLKNICGRLLLKIKDLLEGKATGHNDHYLTNMGDQRPKAVIDR